jgi:dTMP kinase
MPAPIPFITFEGGEGAGKSTQISLLVASLKATGHEVCTVQDPGTTELGEDLRTILKYAPYAESICSCAEALLFAASRAQLVDTMIRPALDAGKIVLCDRFTDSTLAYQGAGRGISAEQILSLNKLATGQIVPSLTILLDIPAHEGLARAMKRREAEPPQTTASRGIVGAWFSQKKNAAAPATTPFTYDRMEMQTHAFYERVRQAFLDMAAREPTRFFIVNARLPQEEIARAILGKICQFLQE